MSSIQCPFKVGDKVKVNAGHSLLDQCIAEVKKIDVVLTVEGKTALWPSMYFMAPKRFLSLQNSHLLTEMRQRRTFHLFHRNPNPVFNIPEKQALFIVLSILEQQVGMIVSRHPNRLRICRNQAL